VNTEPTEAEKSETAALYKKIRKLLRLSKEPGPEGENAKARADELMAKHGLKVSLEDENFRLLVEDVAGEFWREQLLYATASRRKCKLMLGTQRDAKLASLVGEKKHAEDALANYHILAAQLVYECGLDWDAFVLHNTPINNGHLDHAFRIPEVVMVWKRLYLINAAQTLRNRLAGVPRPRDTKIAEEPVPEDVVPDNAPPQRLAESKQQTEEERTAKDLSALETLFGALGAEQFQAAAWFRGMDLGNSISVEDGSRAASARRLTG
jgi:Protein of unknown function (DUF2786)